MSATLQRATRWLRRASGAACVVALAACAQAAPPAGADGTAMRILVKLARPSEDAAAIAASATRLAGVPVAYAAAVSPQWHALLLRCPTPAECDRALQSLRGASDVYLSVAPDDKVRALGAPPT